MVGITFAKPFVMSKEKLRCVYESGVTISDPKVLSTLSLVYDQIDLVHPFDFDPDAKQLVRWPFDKLDDLEWALTFGS